ncbi:putative CREB-binding protein [Ditylenchus destructor]|uniref:CREB-binding protein n=1 Tax=Ditylenchus destructor TaxID=166010 RepID=A0AAD4N746_9BILA|nr:putative CREB-binding protein [Ditylenchus destructor]
MNWSVNCSGQVTNALNKYNKKISQNFAELGLLCHGQPWHGSPYFAARGLPHGSPYFAARGLPHGSPYFAARGLPHGSPYFAARGLPHGSPYFAARGLPHGSPYFAARGLPHGSPYFAARRLRQGISKINQEQKPSPAHKSGMIFKYGSDLVDKYAKKMKDPKILLLKNEITERMINICHNRWNTHVKTKFVCDNDNVDKLSNMDTNIVVTNIDKAGRYLLTIIMCDGRKANYGQSSEFCYSNLVGAAYG